MWTWLHTFIVNRKRIGPPPVKGQTCGIPGCNAPAVDSWCPSTCALREANVPAVWVPVCAECDVRANEQTVRFFFGDQYENELSEYRARTIAK